MKWMIGILMAALLFAAGCSKGNESQPEPAGDQAKPAEGQPAAEIKDEDLPVAADFEEAAAGEVTADNYKQELDNLDKEISAE